MATTTREYKLPESTQLIEEHPPNCPRCNAPASESQYLNATRAPLDWGDTRTTWAVMLCGVCNQRWARRTVHKIV